MIGRIWIMPTIDYYNKNAKDFVSSTINVDFKDIQNRFLNTLSNKNALILDFGCGAGTDTKYFLEQSYQVEAIDGSERLCMMASEYTGIQVQHTYLTDEYFSQDYFDYLIIDEFHHSVNSQYQKL